MKVHETEFSGAMLKRGFWLYVWRVTTEEKEAFYVGRTGDSSSKYAASPFSRLGQHLDIRPTATANTLLRNIRAALFDPLQCKFKLISIGPLFPEQSTLKAHRKYRDIVAPLEAALAEHLKLKGHRVLGTHPKSKACDQKLFKKIKQLINGRLR
ncbi:MAG: hypothetical protein E6R07_13105 [Nevskiaceae bacterium]|nr:MAG: hypothetical protein E6R07_13105 [Nevskiaceae bacterium]